MNYISLQFGGPRIQAFISAIESYFNSQFKVTIDYFTILSIDSANEAHTEMIGRLIGFPRPLIQKEQFMTGLFRFTTSYYTDVDVGFSYNYDSAAAGGLLTEVPSYENLIYMDLTTYKLILKIIAKAIYSGRRYSLTLIDEICKTIAGTYTYTIVWTDSNKNILITFSDLKEYSVYIVGYVLNFLFDTMPKITVTKGV